MPLCSNTKSNNFTFLLTMPDIENNRLYYRLKGESWPRGKYADFVNYHMFLEDPEVLRSNGRCKFVYADSVGSYFPGNNSHTGCMQLMVEEKADLFNRPMDFFSIDQSLVGYSDVLLSIAYHPFQLINRKTQNEQSLAKLIDFLIPSSSFLLVFLFTLLFYLLDRTLFWIFKSFRLKRLQIGRKFWSLCSNLRRNLRQNLNQNLHQNLRQNPPQNLRPRILTISFVLFMFFVTNFFEGNLNTSTVILDYSDLLYSNQQLLGTTNEFCFLEKSIEYGFFEKSPNDSLVRRIYEKRNKIDPCFLSVNCKPGNLLDRDLKKIFLLLPDLNLRLTSRVIQALVRSNTFIGEEKLYEILRAFIIRKNLENLEIEKKAFLNRFVQTVLQFGFYRKMFNNIPNWTVFDLPKEGGKDGYQTFLNLFEFLDEYTRVTALPLDRLDYFFRLCLALQCVLLFAQLTHYTLDKLLLIKRTYKRLRFV